MGNSANTICAKLPEDLLYAVTDRAEAEGISISELLRAVLTQFIYGTTPAVGEGYEQAKRLATQIAYKALADSLEYMPESVEDHIEAMKDVRRKGG